MAGETQFSCGARETEAEVLAAVAAAMAEARQEPALLAAPLRVVVPSNPLRVHLGARLAAHCGALAGVRVQTLRGLACEVLERAGVVVRPGDAWLPVLVQRHASTEPALRAVLAPLLDAYGSVTGAVGDLLDAGFEPALAEGVSEAIAESPLGEAVRSRAVAVAGVALAVQAELAEQGLLHRAGLLVAAREALEADSAGLPTRALLVHGFADVTGVAGDFLEALLRCFPGVVFVDRPPSPGEALSDGAPFVERFVSRMALGASLPAAVPRPAPAPPTLLRAPGADAEVRGVGERVRALLDAGAAPESIGLVARDLAPYGIALRRQLGRLAIPFTAGSSASAPAGPVARGAAALLELLRDPRRLAAERWLDACAAGTADRARGFLDTADLRLAFHAAGAGRLAEVAALDADTWLDRSGMVPLPVRAGLRASGSKPRAARRRMDGALFSAQLQRARALLERIERWPRLAPLEDHARTLRALLREDLGWESGPLRDDVESLLDTLAEELPPACTLTREELIALLDKPLRGAGAAPLGGEGGGVAVLSVMEARAHTFEHLFVLGLNRDAFPRAIHEDPLLPDALRRALAASALPDMPIKERGFDEERYLFAQLVSSSPVLTLSWQLAGDDGRCRNRSPFAEGLRLGLDAGVNTLPPSLGAPLPEEPVARRRALLRPAHEHAVLAGLHGSPAQQVAALTCALAERSDPMRAAGRALAELRVAVLREHEPAVGPPARLGPYLGWVGPPLDPADPRVEVPYVTLLESVAHCPWQGFLRRVLRLEPLPDALEALPEVGALIIGSTTHAVLERIAGFDHGESLDTALAREPRPLRWPTQSQLAALCGEEAARSLREAGIPGRGHLELLTRHVEVRVVRAAALLREPGHEALGAEVEGVVSLEGGTVAMRFRADLVEATRGGVLLTDFKSGGPPKDGGAAARRTALERGLRSGQRLQAFAYAQAAGGTGRYLYLAPDLEHDAAAEARAAGDDPELGAAFAASSGAVLEALRAGQLPPRLLDEKGDSPRDCEHCEVASACLRGDSATRRRLADWFARPAADAADDPARAVFGLEAPR